MARFSQNGVSPAEADQLRKTLRAVDNRVVLPDSLRGSALLQKLDGIEPDVPTKRKISELVLPKRNRVRILAGYAAAFVLVVGLFYNLGINRPTEQGGEIEILGPAAELVRLQEGGGVSAGNGVPAAQLFGQYLLFHAPNPDTDSEMPYLLLLLDADGQTVISQVELPKQMHQISRFYVDGSIVSLISRGEQPFTFSVDFTDLENPVALLQ